MKRLTIIAGLLSLILFTAIAWLSPKRNTLNRLNVRTTSTKTSILNQYATSGKLKNGRISLLRFKLNDSEGDDEVEELDFDKPLAKLKPAKTKQVKKSTVEKLNIAKKELLNENEDIDEDMEPEGPTGIRKKISRVMVPIGASVGFAATPSPKLALRIAGAALGGLTGLIGKKIFFPEAGDQQEFVAGPRGRKGRLSEAVKKALKIIASGPVFFSITARKLEEIARRCGVEEEDLGVFFTYMFSEGVLLAISKAEDLTELGELISFAESGGFTGNEIGDGFVVAALALEKRMKRNKEGFYSTFTKDDLAQAARVIFIADKMIGSSSSSPEDGFHTKQLSTALSFFTPELLKAEVTAASRSVFRNCLETVMQQPNTFTSKEVTQLKSFLTTSPHLSDFGPASMEDMMAKSLARKLDASLGAPSAFVDMKTLTQAKAVLGWVPEEFDRTILSRSLPLFTDEARVLVNTVAEKPSLASEKAAVLLKRATALGIDARSGRSALMDLVRAKNEEFENEIERVYLATNKAIKPAFGILSQYAQVHAALETLCAPLMADASVPIPTLPFTSVIKAKIFDVEVAKGAKKSKIPVEMFSLDDNEQDIVRKALALPKVSSWIQQCLLELNFSDDAKAAYKKLLKEIKVTDQEWAATSLDFYYQEVKRVATARQVPTAADMSRLATIASFLDCDADNVKKIHLEMFGDKYAKAVSEAMYPSGVITEEYLVGLDRLRDRLGLSAEDSRRLLGYSARTRLQPLVKDLVDIWKSETDSTKRKEIAQAKVAKKGGDRVSSYDNVFGYVEVGAEAESSGPDVFMREALNLVDFFKENYVALGADLENLETLPVTAVGLTPRVDLEGALKHYIITRLGEADASLRARYINDERLFALILGVAPSSQEKLKETLSYSAYRNMLLNILRAKEGGVDAQDVKQFALLKENLGLSQEVADKQLSDASKSALLEHVASFIRPKQGVIEPAMARRFRIQVQSMDLDIKKDAGFSNKLVAYFFALEVQYMIENDLLSEIPEAQEVYDIPQDRAEAVIEACAGKFVSQLLNLALRASKKYDEVDALRWMIEVAKFSQFISSPVLADGNLFSEDDKQRMISFYAASLTAEGDEDVGVTQKDIEDECERLKALVVLSKDFVPPINGINGLLGALPGTDQFSDTDIKDDKKKWAWG